MAKESIYFRVSHIEDVLLQALNYPIERNYVYKLIARSFRIIEFSLHDQ